MSIFALLSLSSAILVFALGNFIYYQDRKSSLNRIFLALSIVIAGWAFCEFMYRQAGSSETAYLWVKADQFVYFLPAIFVHFALIFSELSEHKKILKNKATYILIYTPPLILSIIDIFTHQITVTPVKEYWGYTYGVPANSIPLTFFHVWAMVLAVFGVYLIVRSYFITTDKNKKQQVKYFFIGAIIPVVFSAIEATVTQLNIRIPELTVISMNWLVIFIAYSIWKYELFVLDPATASENIVSTMSDSLILLDQKGNVVNINKATSSLFGYSKQELVGKSISMLLAADDYQNKLINKVIEKKSVKDSESTFKNKKGESIIVSLSGSVLKDRTGETAGIVLVGHDITERKKNEEAIKKNSEKLGRMNKFMVGREMKIKELKRENEELRDKIAG